MNTELTLEVTKKDVKDARDVGRAFHSIIRGKKLKPSEIASPITMAILRATDKGFPIHDNEGVAVINNDAADVLRSVFKRFTSGKSTPEQFSAAALPLLLQLRSEVASEETATLMDLIGDHQGGQN
jgi:hypothetical protein